MKKTSKDPDMRDEYDFSKAVVGKYAGRFTEGSNVVVLDPDVAQMFRTSEAVNRALRALGEIVREVAPAAEREEKLRSKEAVQAER